MPRARAFSIMAGDRSMPSSRAASGLNASPARPVPQPRSRIGKLARVPASPVGQLAAESAARHSRAGRSCACRNRRRIDRRDGGHSRDRSAAPPGSLGAAAIISAGGSSSSAENFQRLVGLAGFQPGPAIRSARARPDAGSSRSARCNSAMAVGRGSAASRASPSASTATARHWD